MINIANFRVPVDFMKPVTEGAVCLFALKNPSFPEYIINTESSAMCVDLHPKWPFMLVIGLYNGIIEIYNIKGSCTVPAYRSNSVQNKHGDIVWQVIVIYIYQFIQGNLLKKALSSR